MKNFILVGFLIVAAFFQVEGRSISKNDEVPPVLRELIEQSFACISKMSPSQTSQLPHVHGKEQFPEDNSALNKLWGCIWKKKGIINEEGVFSEDKLAQYLVDVVSMVGTVRSENLEVVQDIVQQCKNVHGYDYGQTAVKIENCIRNYIQQRY